MLVFIILLPAQVTLSPDSGLFKAVPVFTAWREEKGRFFAFDRLERAFVHYGLLHMLPALVWSVLMPLQYWDGLRRSRPALHRVCGYTAFVCAFILAISGLGFMVRQPTLSWSNPAFTMHRIYGLPILPSFNTYAIVFASPALLITMCRALYLARNRRFAEHRRWAVLHGIAGYIISLQRVWMLIVNFLGNILAKSPRAQELLGTNKIRGLLAISEAEKAAFALTVWGAGMTCAVWVWHLYRSNPTSSSSKKNASLQRKID
jgi:hypothetical protein